MIPSFSGSYVLWLSHLVPYLFAPKLLLGPAGVLMIAGVMLQREIRDVELNLPDLGGEPVQGITPVAAPGSA